MQLADRNEVNQVKKLVDDLVIPPIEREVKFYNLYSIIHKLITRSAYGNYVSRYTEDKIFPHKLKLDKKVIVGEVEIYKIEPQSDRKEYFVGKFIGTDYHYPHLASLRTIIERNSGH